MGFVFFCIGTIVISIYMNISIEFKLLKDVADEGYKIDPKKLSETMSEIAPNSNKENIMKLFKHLTLLGPPVKRCVRP